jgi:hypothetical protein
VARQINESLAAKHKQHLEETLSELERKIAQPAPTNVPTHAPATTGQEGVDIDAEIIKLRWTLVTLTKSLNVLRYQITGKPTNPDRIANLTLALRHLEDAEARLNRIINP